MLKLLLVGNNLKSLPEFNSVLKGNDENEILYADTSETALKKLKDNAIDLVITDEEIEDMSGLAFIRKLISINPLINCVAVSGLSEKDFHEASEGLGLMNHLPVNPGSTDAEVVIKTLKHIKGLETG